MAQSTQGWPPPGLTASDGDEAEASGLRDTPGERWYSCDKCGQLFADSDTIVDEFTGRRLCLTGPNDYDEASSDDSRNIGFSRLFSLEE